MAFDKNQLTGYFKEREGEKVELVPDWAEIQKSIAFKSRQKLGEVYRFPVCLTRSHGVTFKGGAAARTVYELRTPKSAQFQDAQVVGSEITIQEDVAYGALAATQGEGAAFGDLMDETTFQMEGAARFYLELQLLYGRSSIAAIESSPGAAAGGERTFVISEASWAAGVWAQLEGGCLDAYSADFVTPRNTPSPPEGAGTPVVVVSVDAELRTVVLSGLDAELDAIVATDVLTPAGWVGNTMSGIDAHALNTSVIHNIDAGAYSLWNANRHDAGGVQLTMDILQRASTRGVVRGQMGDTTVLLSPYSWTDLNTDLAALRRAPKSMKAEMDNGTTKIQFHGVSGTMSLVSHPMVKAGEAFIYEPAHFKRIGSQDIGFTLKGAEGQNQNFYQELPNSTGFRLRCWGDQGLIHCKPNCLTKVFNINNASLS